MGEAFDPAFLPPRLPEPEDDGAADHLPGLKLPDLRLPATDGSLVRLDKTELPLVVYAYPYTARPGDRPFTEAGTSSPAPGAAPLRRAAFVTTTPS